MYNEGVDLRLVCIRQGDIVYITKEDHNTIGHEQRPGRPAVVIQAGKTTCMVVYLTTRGAETQGLEPWRVRIPSAPRPSVAICDQIKTIDDRRVDRVLGHVTPEEMQQVKDMVAECLGIDRAVADRRVQDLQCELIQAKAAIRAWKEVALELRGGFLNAGLKSAA